MRPSIRLTVAGFKVLRGPAPIRLDAAPYPQRQTIADLTAAGISLDLDPMIAWVEKIYCTARESPLLNSR